MVNIKELLDLTSQSCNTRERARGSLPANRALNSDQVISGASATAPVQRASWSGPQAPSSKPQAASVKLSNQPVQASSNKPQARKRQLQAPSHKQQAPRYVNHGTWILEKY